MLWRLHQGRRAVLWREHSQMQTAENEKMESKAEEWRWRVCTIGLGPADSVWGPQVSRASKPAPWPSLCFTSAKLSAEIRPKHL